MASSTNHALDLGKQNIFFTLGEKLQWKRARPLKAVYVHLDVCAQFCVTESGAQCSPASYEAI